MAKVYNGKVLILSDEDRITIINNSITLVNGDSYEDPLEGLEGMIDFLPTWVRNNLTPVTGVIIKKIVVDDDDRIKFIGTVVPLNKTLIPDGEFHQVSDSDQWVATAKTQVEAEGVTRIIRDYRISEIRLSSINHEEIHEKVEAYKEANPEKEEFLREIDGGKVMLKTWPYANVSFDPETRIEKIESLEMMSREEYHYDYSKNSAYEHELGVAQGAYAEDAGIYGWDLD